MASAVDPALRAELEQALAVIEPQIRGLHDLTTTSITAELKAAIEAQIVPRERRRDLIKAVLTALDALEADGYPALDKADLPANLFDELQGENTDIEAAVDVFEESGPASHIAVSLGEPAEKPA